MKKQKEQWKPRIVNIMAEAILTLWAFAVSVLAVAIVEQRKWKLERRKRELNTERQQVDKEEKRYARVAE